MNIANQLVNGLATRISSHRLFHSKLFTDYRYVFGPSRCCHTRTIKLIHQVAGGLKGVSAVTGNKALLRGRAQRWHPDAVLWDDRDRPLCVVEYESINSSDSRIVFKDCGGYERWLASRADESPVPLLIVTTHPKGPTAHYQLLYARKEYYNDGHQGQEEMAKRDPFKYWYGWYREQLRHKLDGLPVTFANLNGNQLERVKM